MMGAGRMLWYKSWRESSSRFLLSAGIVAVMCAVYTLLESKLMPGVMQEHKQVTNYFEYIDWVVFGGATRGIFQLICLLLGMGGMQRDRKQNSLGATLALPVGRVQLVATRAAVGLSELAALAMMVPVVVMAGSMAAGQPISMEWMLGFVPLWVVGGFFTFAVSFLCSVLFTSEYVSLAVAYVAYMFLLAGARHPQVAKYHMHVADFMSGRAPGQLDPHTVMWMGVYPLTPVAGFFAAGLLMVAIATAVTLRQDL